MAKPFSEMTPLEAAVNRHRLRHGFDAGWTEDIGVRYLPGREGDVVQAAILDHVNKTMSATNAAHARERHLGDTLRRLGLDK